MLVDLTSDFFVLCTKMDVHLYKALNKFYVYVNYSGCIHVSDPCLRILVENKFMETAQ